ncbi:MAG: M28 family peptidase [Thermomicrobiales bacterium]
MRDAVSLENLKRDNAAIAKDIRLSGSAAEAEAFAYIADRCRSFGMAVREYAVDAYVSLPGAAALSVVAPDSRDITCITHSFSVATEPEGRVGPLVAVGRGTAATDYAGKDVRGAIALVDGLASPGAALAAERAGAVGMICVNPEGLHEMIISPVWGTPTPQTAPYLPKIAAVSIRKEEGDSLKALVARGPVTVRLQTEVETGWRPIPTLTAEMRGTEDRFVLLSGHVDSWHYGAMDNASANATMLEIGRVVSAHKGELRRGLRLAFWSGHSHARYGASAWYADTFFADLYDHCVCHVNAESTGGMGATNVSTPGNMAETWHIAAGVVRDLLGEPMTYHRQGRSHDQSFTGVGVPSILCGFSGPGEGGAAWWWHTPDDTLDKIDDANLVRDTQVYVLTCWRLCTVPILPFNFAETANELRDRLHMLQESANGRFDLAPLIADADALHADAERLNAAVAAANGDATRTERLNAAIMAVAHALIPVNYTLAGPFEVDLALGSPVLPGLAPVTNLAAMDPASNDAGFLRTQLVRERNRVQHAIATARREIARAW